MLLVAGCATGPDVEVPSPGGASTVQVSSPDFTPGGDLPTAFTCDGAGGFPAITWAGLPTGTVAVAVLVYDPDASGGDYVHRLVTNIDPAAGELAGAATPPGGLELTGSDGTAGWVPPCPPKGDGGHRYVFTVYALNRPTRLPSTAQTQTALVTVTEAAVGQGSLTALYARP
jgi:Raf kinase inhibitor-like YbhB/YbcL family protein